MTDKEGADEVLARASETEVTKPWASTSAREQRNCDKYLLPVFNLLLQHTHSHTCIINYNYIQKGGRHTNDKTISDLTTHEKLMAAWCEHLNQTAQTP